MEAQLKEFVNDNLKYIFIVNANKQIGGGHLNRCINIANELAITIDKSNILFVHWSLDTLFDDMIKYENAIIEQNLLLSFIENLSHKHKGVLVIIDSDDEYVHNSFFQESLNALKVHSAYFTVNTKYFYSCDILINPNILSLYQKYNTSPSTKRLFGPSYFIYKKAFRDLKVSPQPQVLSSVIITMGTADPANHTIKILKLLKDIPVAQNLKFIVVLGRLFPFKDALKRETENITLNVELLNDVQDMKSLMEECQLAICSPGTTFWELALLGIPSIILSSANREVESANILHEKGYGHCLLHYNEPVKAIHKESLAIFLEKPQEIAPHLNELRSTINSNGINNLVDSLLNSFSDSIQ